MSAEPKQLDTAPASFPPEWMPRFDAAQKKLESLPTPPGFADIYVFDRATKAVWSAGDVTRPGWTASTIKLAIALDLRERVHLSSADHADMHAILHSSDNEATDRLWARYGGDEMLARFRDRFGMLSLAFQPGFSETTYWRFVKCSTLDLVSLGQYVLEHATAEDRRYLLEIMRGVADNQRWGVWAAGPHTSPAVKNGWAEKPDDWGKHWLMRSIGFVGAQERYVVAVNYQQPSPGDLETGVQVVSDLVALVFGQPTPASVSIPLD